FKAIISPSFADIFYNNCLTNGVLPVRLPSYEVDYLFSDDDLSIEIDLAKQSVTAGLHTMHFQIDNFHKKLLLEGLDSIGLTLKLEDYISRYEKQKQLFALRGN
ncbi:MAG: 3-isopropylmalate dehydratase small subunit, partial [Thermoproteota archaeon]|nr:3-isopropylmalate dehydratase small subunit [Thermoproteota archaeon]